MAHRIDRTLSAPPQRNHSEAALVATFGLIFGTTPSEGRVLLRLVKYHHCTRPELHAAIANGEPATGVGIVAVVVGRLRAKLRVHDIGITNIFAQGFRLDPTARDKIRNLLAEFGEDVIAATTPATTPDGAEKTEAA